MSNPHEFSELEKQAVYQAMAKRRDMRHFNGQPLDELVLKKILRAAHLAPSVGLMQPWRFIRVSDQSLISQLKQSVEKERINTAKALEQKSDDFLKLKVEGIDQCSEVIIAALPDQRDKHIFGRRTLPEMDLASLSCAIQNMWLAARVEGIGMGWVSLFDPEDLKSIFNMPQDSHPVAILCIGHVDKFYEKPMLVLEKWAEEKPLEDLIFENSWNG